jgi:hypothetical protein
MMIAFNFVYVGSFIGNGSELDRHWKSLGVGQDWAHHHSRRIYTSDIVMNMERKDTVIFSFPKDEANTFACKGFNI